MSQGTILHTHNLNLNPESQPAKNRKYSHVAQKNAIELSVM
jgi:hypothetical protein